MLNTIFEYPKIGNLKGRPWLLLLYPFVIVMWTIVLVCYGISYWAKKLKGKIFKRY